MEKENSKLNIYQKLIEVRKSVPYLKKDNQGYQFQYVSSSQTLGSLKMAMDEQGLLLIPDVVSDEVANHETKKGDHEYFTRLRMTFTWVNADCPEEQIECRWVGQGLDSGEKGVGKALTYAEKYFMLKFFNIPTDKDDPDSFQHKTERTKPVPNTQEIENRVKGMAAMLKDAPGIKELAEEWNNKADERKDLPNKYKAQLRGVKDKRKAVLIDEQEKGKQLPMDGLQTDGSGDFGMPMEDN